MGQVRGSQTAAQFLKETSYGTPGTNGHVLHFTSFGLSSRRNLIDSNTITAERTRKAPMDGNEDVSGPVAVEFSNRAATKLLYHALGEITTSGAVSSVTTTGASSATTVTFSAPPSGTTATGTISGGVVTITEPGSGYQAAPTVTLDAGTAVASMVYTHVITPGPSLPAGLTFEMDYGELLTNRYAAYKGCRINSLDIDIPTEGPVMMTANLQGREVVPDDTSLDDTPADYGHAPFSAFNGTIQEGGSTIATVTTAKLTINNDLDTASYTIAGDGKRAELPEGLCKISGTITALFADETLMNKSLNGTESSLKFILQRGTGAGTAGNEYVSFYMPTLVYEPVTPPVRGPKGVLITLNFHAYYASAGSEAIRVTVKNQINASSMTA